LDLSKQRSFWYVIRDLIAVCGLLGAIFASLVVANGWGSGGEQGVDVATQAAPREQIFATDPFSLETGLAVVEMTHRGEGRFVVNLVSAVQDEAATSGPVEFSRDKNGGSNTEVAIALVDERGPADISKAIKVLAAGEHVFEVTADGAWSVKIEQPGPSDATQMTSFSGDEDTATPLFRLSSGPKRITSSNPNGGELQVSLLDEDGNVVTPVRATEPDQAGEYPSDATATIDVPESGVYLFNVRADSLWAIDIADAG
jgi:hypothetical protein